VLRGRIRKLLGGRLKAIVCGGGPLPAYLDRFFAALGVAVLEGYGLTEASPIVSMRSERAPVLGTVGRPLPSTEVRILADDGKVQPAGHKGSVVVKGPQVMLGYYKEPDATRQILSPDGWLTTGDTGLLTVDGNLVITGRRTHTIVMRSGERVEPEPIELATAGTTWACSSSPTGSRCASSRNPARSPGRSRSSSWGIPLSSASTRRRCSPSW